MPVIIGTVLAATAVASSTGTLSSAIAVGVGSASAIGGIFVGIFARKMSESGNSEDNRSWAERTTHSAAKDAVNGVRSGVKEALS